MPLGESLLINRSHEPRGHLALRWNKLKDDSPDPINTSRSSAEDNHYTYRRLYYHHEAFRLPASSDDQINVPEDLDMPPKTAETFAGNQPRFTTLSIQTCCDASNVESGNFFAKCIACWPESDTKDETMIPAASLYAEVDIPALIVTHRVLCKQIKKRLGKHQIPGRDEDLIIPLFEKVIVVVDIVNWDWQGLAIVRSDQAHPLRLECNNFDIPQLAFREGDQGQVFRARL
ncbi:MAG: hypothetical protein HETSPECPRED_008538 [Heterodermia speciosa]|uniref:Uncharacterized protein n=1 Tax=Heterodermia speciosa TaxID=116794 RepID=A0A8H3G208_9LECA|nr:MAG: hypothetical protein HETSPECPRED_008538 [Heterodermia speciosa]